MSKCFKYHGKVKLKTADNTYESANNGTSKLFNMLCSLLGIMKNNLAYYPAYISILAFNSQQSDFEQPYDSYINATDKPIQVTLSEIIITNRSIIKKQGDDSILKLSGLLTYANTRKDADGKGYSGKYIYALLLDSTKTDILAFSKIAEAGDINAVAGNSLGQAEISWEMSFTNN